MESDNKYTPLFKIGDLVRTKDYYWQGRHGRYIDFVKNNYFLIENIYYEPQLHTFICRLYMPVSGLHELFAEYDLERAVC